MPAAGVIRVGVALSLVGLLFVFAYQDTLLSLHKIWSANNETYSHGYLLLAGVVYLLYVQAHQMHFQSCYWPLVLGVLISLCWVVANSAQLQLLQQVALPALLLCFGCSLTGLRNCGPLLLPLLSLYLGTPVADFLTLPLQVLTTTVVAQWIHWAGITALVDGFNIHFPSGSLRIVGGCAGVNYLLAGLCFGIFYSHLHLYKLRNKALAIILSIGVALLGNWVRVFLLVLIGYYSEMQSPLVYEHGMLGWFVFAVFLLVYIFTMSRLEVPRSRDEIKNPSTVSASLPKLGTIVIAGMAISLLPALVTLQNRQQNKDISKLEQRLPEPLLQRFKPSPSSVWQPSFKGYDLAFVWEGYSNSLRLELSSYYYLVQHQGKELIYFSNKITKTREQLSQQQLVLSPQLKLNQSIIQTEQGYRLVWWFYQVGQELTLSDFDTKFAQIKQMFQAPVAKLVTLSTSCGSASCSRELELVEASDIEELLVALPTIPELTTGQAQ
nr:exosortase [Aliagarivorans marinus]